MREQIINNFLADKSYQAACKRIDYKNWQDLYQETCVAICEMKTSKLIKACERKYFRGVVIRTILNIRNNKARNKSPLFMACNNAIEVDVENESSKLNIDELEEIIYSRLTRDEKSKFFESRLMRAYLHYGSYRKLSKAADIPYQTIQSTLQPYVKQLRKALNKELND